MVNFKNEKSAIRQIELVEKLIKTSEENDVDNLELTVDKKVGLSLGANIEGATITTTLGSDDKMTLKVTYK